MNAGGELRFDPLTREWVSVVAHRQHRPNLPPAAGCPFCVGGLEAPEPYDVRAFRNRWPPMTPGAPLDASSAASEAAGAIAARGDAEIVLYSPDHDASLSTLPPEHVERVVDLWAARTQSLLSRPEVRYVLVFENRGREVGATIDHPHGQIYAYGFVPPVPRRLEEVAARHGDPLRAELVAERRDGRRIVSSRGAWSAYVPYASAYPYGIRLVPDIAVSRLDELDGAARADLAWLLVDVTGRYDALFVDPAPFPYLMWIHQNPEPYSDTSFRLHVQFAPPWRDAGVARFIASGEVGSGTLSNPVAPESAADRLRAALD